VHRARQSMSSAFYSKCQSSGECIQWIGGRHTRYDYGVFNYKGIPIDVRRAALAISGKTHKGGVVVSTCGCSTCVNPVHIKLVTREEWWKQNKERFPSRVGEKNPNSRITKQDAQTIRLEWKNGINQSELARRFLISRAAIRLIISDKLWKDT